MSEFKVDVLSNRLGTGPTKLHKGTVSEIVVDQGLAPGEGTTYSKIRYMALAPIVSTGTAITRATNATDGDSYTINQNGVYAIQYSDLIATGFGGNNKIGISKNATVGERSTDIDAIAAANRLVVFLMNDTGGTSGFWVSWTGFLTSGDVIRPHIAGTASQLNGDNSTRFQIRMLFQNP